MGVLDELKKEAKAIEEQRTRQDTERTAMQRQVLQGLLPHMRRTHTYFKEFQHHLSIVDPEVVVSYDLREFGKLTNLRQMDYKVSAEQPAEVERFQFRFVCAREGGSVEVPSRDPTTSGEIKDYLKANGLRAKQRDAGRGASVFIVEARVPAVMDFRIDLEREAVALGIRNVNQLGTIRYTLGPDRLTPQLLDELAKMVLRKPNEFDDLMGNKLTDTGIYRIREKLQAQQSEGAPVTGEVAVSPTLEKPTLSSRLLRKIRKD